MPPIGGAGRTPARRRRGGFRSSRRICRLPPASANDVIPPRAALVVLAAVPCEQSIITAGTRPASSSTRRPGSHWLRRSSLRATARMPGRQVAGGVHHRDLAALVRRENCAAGWPRSRRRSPRARYLRCCSPTDCCREARRQLVHLALCRACADGPHEQVGHVCGLEVSSSSLPAGTPIALMSISSERAMRGPSLMRKLPSGADR
jgi:hypothetical protein